MAFSPHPRRGTLLSRVLLASVVWFVTLSVLLALAPRGAAQQAPALQGAAQMSASGMAAAERWAIEVSAAEVSAAEVSAAEESVTEESVTEESEGWAWPLTPIPRVARTFERPPSRYGPGHRGVDLQATDGQSVRAVADGVVTHSGVVAGRGTVTVRHGSGIASTYEPVEARVPTGTVVSAGDLLGVMGTSGHCARSGCLHLGARLGEEYLDPLLLLTRVRIILLPLLESGR